PLAHVPCRARPPHDQVSLRLLDAPDSRLRLPRPDRDGRRSRHHRAPRLREGLLRGHARRPPTAPPRHPARPRRRTVRDAGSLRRDARAHLPRVPSQTDLYGPRGPPSHPNAPARSVKRLTTLLSEPICRGWWWVAASLLRRRGATGASCEPDEARGSRERRRSGATSS